MPTPQPPSSPTPTPTAAAADLTAEQRAFVADCCSAFFELADAAGVSERDLTDGDAADACDAVVRWWHDTPDDEKPDDHTACNILGVALGELLREAYPALEWKMVTDSGGTSLALWKGSPNSSAPPVVVAPIDSVLQRFHEEPDGFFGPLLDSLAAITESLLKGKPPPPPSADDSEED